MSDGLSPLDHWMKQQEDKGNVKKQIDVSAFKVWEGSLPPIPPHLTLKIATGYTPVSVGPLHVSVPSPCPRCRRPLVRGRRGCRCHRRN